MSERAESSNDALEEAGEIVGDVVHVRLVGTDQLPVLTADRLLGLRHDEDRRRMPDLDLLIAAVCPARAQYRKWTRICFLIRSG